MDKTILVESHLDTVNSDRLFDKVIIILEKHLNPVKIGYEYYQPLSKLIASLYKLIISTDNTGLDSTDIPEFSAYSDDLNRLLHLLAEFPGQVTMAPQISEELLSEITAIIKLEKKVDIYKSRTFLKSEKQLQQEVEDESYFDAIMTLATITSAIERSNDTLKAEMQGRLMETLSLIYKHMEEEGETIMQNVFFKKLSNEYGFKWMNRMFCSEYGVVYVVKKVGSKTLTLERIANKFGAKFENEQIEVNAFVLERAIKSGEYKETFTAKDTKVIPEVVVFDEALRGDELNKVYHYAEDSDGETIAKTRFTDELIRASSSNRAQKHIRNETPNEDENIDKKIDAVKQRYTLFWKVKVNILSKLTQEGTFSTKKGTILNLGKEVAEGENDKELFFSNIDQKVQFIKYAMILINFDENKTYDLNKESLATVNKNIIEEAPPLTRKEWEYIKKCLGVISQTYYDAIDDEIEEEKVVEVENAMRDIVNNYEGKPRKNTMVMLNGHTGAGKGTTLKLLGVDRASETGTDGIAGRGEGFEHYLEVTESYDFARFAGELMPNKFTRLMLATDIINQRRELDAQGKQDRPVYVSGFPRTVDQAKLFNGINNIKSIGLLITPETAVYRTVRRSIERTLKGQDLRDDDMADMANLDNTPVSKGNFAEAIRVFIQLKDITDPSVLSKSMILELTSTLKLSQFARYNSYERARKGINDSLSSLGIETINIQCDELSMTEVTSLSNGVILGEPVEA